MKPLKISALAATLSLVALPAFADFETRHSDDDVATVMDRLVAAVEAAGATVFARVDHAEGARSVGMHIPEAQVLIFGNPELGTSVMQDDIQAGLFLPMRVLVHDDPDGGTTIVWPEAEEMFDDTGVDDDLPVIEEIEDALDRLTRAAADD